MKKILKFKNKISQQISFFLLPIFIILISSCQGQDMVTHIPKLHELRTEKLNHYHTTANFSALANLERDTLDKITFPSKALALTIKLIFPKYLSRGEIERIMKQIEPPKNSSDKTKAEIEFLIKLQNERTPKQVNEALRMHDIVYFTLPTMKNRSHLFFELYEVYGKEFNPERFPNTGKLLKNIMKEMRVAEFTAKNHFLRARPRQLDSRLKPLKKMKSSSFASGHTLWAYMHAYLLSELIPDKRKEFLNLAYEIGYSREILGVHYPSDEEASRKLAHELMKNMWVKPRFIKDFLLAQQEWTSN